MRVLIMLSTFILMIGALALSASEAEVWYSERGLGSTGVAPAGDLVTEFWDIPAGTDLADVARADGNRGKPPRGWDKLIAGKQPDTSKNIVWRVELPHWGDNGAVVIREKVFLLYEDGWKADAPMLLCLDIHTGKTLWDQPVDHLDALPQGEQKEAKAARKLEQQRYRDYMHWWNKLYWDNTTDTFRSEAERKKMFPAFQKEAAAAGWHFENAKSAKGFKGIRGRMGVKLRDGNIGGRPTDAKLVANYKKVLENRWHIRQGWTTEHPWYGNVHGSVVSDGENVYAVTGPGAVACYDLNGKRRWVQWMNANIFRSGGTHGNVQSPVLADGKLIYFQRDSATMYAFDAKTGKQQFATRTPADPKGREDAPFHNFSGHIGPGSTTVILNLGGTTVAIAGNGMVVGVSDGKMVGLVAGKIHSYWDMAGTNDIYVATFSQGKGKPRQLGAVRLGIENDELTQKQLWASSGPSGAGIGNWQSGSNVVIDDNRVLAKFIDDNMCALELETGKVLGKGGAITGYYGYGDGHYVTQSDYKFKEFVRHRSAHVVDSRTLQTVGTGLLVEPPATGEIAERHIGFLGWGEIWTGYGKPTVWGNRIFIRTNDYLWCIGDPKKKFSAPAPIGK